MRHRVSTQRLGKKPHQAKMMERNLLTSILLYENVRTTKKRAQVVLPIVDHVITVAKGPRADLAIRRINRIVTDKNACRKAIEVYAKRYVDRTSGFTRTIPVGMREGDGALLVDISFVEGKEVSIKKSTKNEKSTKKATSAKSTTKESLQSSQSSKSSPSSK